MTLNFGELNWLAIAVAAVATFLLGGVWYAALFAKPWQRLNGHSDEKVKQMQTATPPPVFFGIMLVAYFLLAVVLALFVGALGIRGWQGGATFGLLVWAGPALALGLTSWIASDKPVALYMIDWSYQLVFLVMMGAILGAWR